MVSGDEVPSARPQTHNLAVPATPGGGPQRFALNASGQTPGSNRRDVMNGGNGRSETPMRRGGNAAQRRPFMPGQGGFS